MSILSKIRSRIGLVVGFIAVALLVFIVTTAIQSGLSNFGVIGGNYLGRVYGEDVNPKLFEQRVNFFERNNAQNPQHPQGTEGAYKNALDAWNNVVFDLVLRRECAKMGISVSDEMMAEFFVSQNPSPVVMQSPYFMDSTGRGYSIAQAQQMVNLLSDEQFRANNPQNYEMLQAIMDDLQLRVEWDFLYNYYATMIQAGMFAAKNEAERQAREAGQNASVTYLKVDYSSIPDAEAQPTDADYREYYNKHRESFLRQTPEATLKYAFLLKQPSAQDSADARQALADLRAPFREETSPFDFARSQSDAPGGIDTSFIVTPNLPPFAADRLSDLKKDTVIGPVLDGTGYTMMRVVDVRDDSAALYKVSHILVPIAPADTARARAKAARIRAMVNADNWATVVRDSSADMQGKGNGGSLGWMQEQNNPRGAKWDAALKGQVAGAIFTVEDPQGIHICKVDEKSTRSYKVAIIQKNIFPSTQTNELIYAKISKFHQAASGKDLDSVRKSKEFADIPVTITYPVLNPGSYQLPPLSGGRPVIAWGLVAEVGALSPVIELENSFVVAQKTQGGAKGYATLEEVKDQIKPMVVIMVKAKKIKEKLSGMQGGDLNAMATKYGPGATSSSAQGVTFSSPMVAGIGQEPFVIGKIFSLKQGATSAPIVGNSGVFIVRLDAITEAPKPDDNSLNASLTSIRMSKRNSFPNKAFQGLIELAKAEDNRFAQEVPGNAQE